MGIVKRTHPKARLNQQLMKLYQRRKRWRNISPFVRDIFQSYGIGESLARQLANKSSFDEWKRGFIIGFDLASEPDRTAIIHQEGSDDGQPAVSP